ncbi:hypothetical protein BJ166DRAFT_614721 [Pestalotiopsis sp. NC0098]|nr:hypothetical protein BJ166DRAFT_614721 [Pestalotiopsis sp. NC0098]
MHRSLIRLPCPLPLVLLPFDAGSRPPSNSGHLIPPDPSFKLYPDGCEHEEGLGNVSSAHAITASLLRRWCWFFVSSSQLSLQDLQYTQPTLSFIPSERPSQLCSIIDLTFNTFNKFNPIVKMKFSAVLVSALAAVVSAAPATKKAEPRASVDAALFNNFAFNSQDLQYLSAINSLDFNVLQQLATVNGLNLNNFSGLFSNNAFDINSLIQLQQVQNLIQLQQLGVLGGFDLSSFALNQVNLGLINNIGGVDLGQFVDAALIPQIQTIIQQQNHPEEAGQPQATPGNRIWAWALQNPRHRSSADTR